MRFPGSTLDSIAYFSYGSTSKGETCSSTSSLGGHERASSTLSCLVRVSYTWSGTAEPLPTRCSRWHGGRDTGDRIDGDGARSRIAIRKPGRLLVSHFRYLP